MEKGQAKAAMDTYGLDAICERIAERVSLTSIAEAIGVSIGSLLTWVEADPERSARVRETRRAVAALWDERAEQVISDATDDLSLRKAKELAHHYRWRSSKVAPKEYGERVELEHSGTVQTKSDEQLESRLAQLLGKAGASDPAGGESAAEAP